MDKTIKQRISELTDRTGQISVVLENIRQSDGENIQEVREKLVSARKIVGNQIIRYELQKQKISLARIQNSLLPLFFNIDKINDAQINDKLGAIEKNKSEISAIRHSLTQFDTVETLPVVRTEKESFFTQLDDSLNSLQKMREVLLANQAHRALQNIQPLTEISHNSPQNGLEFATETFNLQATVSDFSHTFTELEAEYERIKAEKGFEETLSAK